jgi:tRNA-2-methylthio-N6-dimethylallyladenosine synthase
VTSLGEAWEYEAEAWIRFCQEPDAFAWRFNIPAFLELVPQPGKRTLDIGCGEGRLARELMPTRASTPCPPTQPAFRSMTRRSTQPSRRAARADPGTRVARGSTARGAVDEDTVLPAPEGAANLGRAVKRYHVTTFGCQMNEHDSERMKGMLESLGYSESPARDDADVILFNTCSIREKADNRLAGHLGEAKRLKQEDPTKVIGVGGCWAQSLKDQVFEQFPFVDVAFGPGQVPKLAEFLTSDSISAQGFFEFEGFTGHLPMKRAREFQGWVQISVGCNCACSYCIVPSTRGREVSRPATELVEEVERLAQDGVREITLLGQNVNSYGRDLPKPDKHSFAELLYMLDAIDGIDRLRYTSPHPKDMREDVIRAHAELPSVCEHIHLPLQSGSSRVLKAMRRTYNRERYMDRVALIREHVPDCSLTTDIIVGFPGETDADFEETIQVAEEVGYDSAFTFVFSPRRGTLAAELEDQLPHPVKRERMERLVAVVQRRATDRAQRFVGRTVEVLVEGPSRTDPSKLRGRTRHNKTVNFRGAAQPGEMALVEIESATSTTLAGAEKLLAPAGG